MEDGPLVSIIIPACNSSAYVAEAIRSALDQDYERKEIIVVDDGSTDSTPTILQSFGDSITIQRLVAMVSESRRRFHDSSSAAIGATALDRARRLRMDLYKFTV